MSNENTPEPSSELPPGNSPELPTEHAQPVTMSPKERAAVADFTVRLCLIRAFYDTSPGVMPRDVSQALQRLGVKSPVIAELVTIRNLFKTIEDAHNAMIALVMANRNSASKPAPSPTPEHPGDTQPPTSNPERN